MAAGLFALARTSPSVNYSLHAEVPVAAPAE
jgi:AGZA family xanthine/uracil permease-like MFS transporter